MNFKEYIYHNCSNYLLHLYYIYRIKHFYLLTFLVKNTIIPIVRIRVSAAFMLFAAGADLSVLQTDRQNARRCR